MSQDMTTQCQRIAVAFFQSIDHKHFGDAAAFFAADGIWHRHGDDLVGPAQILEVAASRPETQRERHVATNLHIADSGADHCTLIAYVMVFRTDADPAIRAAPIAGANGLADFHFGFRKDGDEWKITSLESRPVFTFKP